MGKKFGEDTRGLKAKAQKAAARSEKERAKKFEKEKQITTQWSKGANVRELDRQKEAERKAEEIRRKKALKDAAAAADEANLKSIKVKKKPRKYKNGSKKDPLADLGDLSFMDKKPKFASQKKKKKKKKQSSGKPAREITAEEELEASGLARNSNKERAAAAMRGDVDASGLNDALDALSQQGSHKVDIHPERRMKAAFKAYEERELPILQEENPGLKRSQLMQRLRKNFEKSPSNPVYKARMMEQQQKKRAWE